MHMADALLSPTVGLSFCGITGVAIVYAGRKVRGDIHNQKIALMGVLGAFIFAAQMINFSIPGTGSSGHLGGGLLLAILLGPCAALIVMASVLIIQSLFFADGGLLALGCNIFNLGIFPCVAAYPLCYRNWVRIESNPARRTAAILFSAVMALQLGSFSVVIQTFLSGKTELPFTSFLMAMQPIHLAIGLVEGLITAAVINFLRRTRPEILDMNRPSSEKKPYFGRVLVYLSVLTLMTAGIFSWFASDKPDGLEWSVKMISGKETLANSEIGRTAARIQDQTAFMPDYQFKTPGKMSVPSQHTGESWITANGSTSLSGILGTILTACLAFGLGILVRKRK